MGRNTARNDRAFERGLYDPTKTYVTGGPCELDAYFYIKRRDGTPLTALEKKQGYDPAEQQSYDRVLNQHVRRYTTDPEYRAQWLAKFAETAHADDNAWFVVIPLLAFAGMLSILF